MPKYYPTSLFTRSSKKYSRCSPKRSLEHIYKVYNARISNHTHEATLGCECEEPVGHFILQPKLLNCVRSHVDLYCFEELLCAQQT